jgi:hypothetical protein
MQEEIFIKSLNSGPKIADGFGFIEFLATGPEISVSIPGATRFSEK